MEVQQLTPTGNYAQAAIWTSVELNAAVISACLPMLRPILKLASSKFGRRRRVSGAAAALGGIGGSSSQQLWNQPWAGPTPERVVRVGKSFFRMSDVPEDPNYGEAWEMWEDGHFQRTTRIERSNSKDRGDQEELGAIQVNAIRATDEIHCHDSTTPV
ncbi:hypothetical protein OEA41_009734 [Lepraria neglecta]|uniref:Rhodopsin domain-containing protein n=1 Tax=Lepraria neglecta TaxID=209136 RepID=A0AAD9Z5G8_9LECA|nr:hypothetical protein OEA41_009734 [Lepraria neglecta]